MGWISGAISEIVETGVAPVLKANGYRRKRRHWMLQLEHVTRTVNVQSSQFNWADAGKFTINLGLAHHEFDGRPVGFVTYADIHQSPIRIGYVMPMRQDYWWEIAQRDDLGAVAVDVQEALARYALPWLDRCSDPMEIVDDLFDRDLSVMGSLDTARKLGVDIVQRSQRSLERWLSYPMAQLQGDNVRVSMDWIAQHLTLSADSGDELTEEQLATIHALLDRDWPIEAAGERHFSERLRKALEQRSP